MGAPQTYQDLAGEIPEGWQLVDVACRNLKLALKTPTFAKMPKTAAVIYSAVATLTKLLSHYTAKGDSGGAPTSPMMTDESDSGGSDAHFVSAGAEAEPPPDSGS